LNPSPLLAENDEKMYLKHIELRAKTARAVTRAHTNPKISQKTSQLRH